MFVFFVVALIVEALIGCFTVISLTSIFNLAYELLQVIMSHQTGV